MEFLVTFVCPLPLLVHHELLVRIFNRWWQEAIISLTLSIVEAFSSNRDQWFFWDNVFIAWTGLSDKTGCSYVVVALSYKVILQCTLFVNGCTVKRKKFIAFYILPRYLSFNVKSKQVDILYCVIYSLPKSTLVLKHLNSVEEILELVNRCCDLDCWEI